MVASRMPAIPGQSTFSRSDAASVQRELPPYVSSTSARIAAGAAQAGYVDYGSKGILPRAIHALNASREPSNIGAMVARRQGFDAVMHGFRGVAGLNGSGCTSTGGQAAQVALATGAAATGAVSTGMAAFTPVQTSPVGTAPVPSTNPTITRAQTGLTITSAALSLAGAIYTGVCQAQGATTPPAVSTISQVGQQTNQLLTTIAAGRANASAATTPAEAASAAAATDANSATAAGNALAPQAGGGDKTMLYVGLGAVALVGLALVLRK